MFSFKSSGGAFFAVFQNSVASNTLKCHKEVLNEILCNVTAWSFLPGCEYLYVVQCVYEYDLPHLWIFTVSLQADATAHD